MQVAACSSRALCRAEVALRSVVRGPGVMLLMTPSQLWSTDLPQPRRYLKVSLRNRHYPGSLTPEQWVLSATPFRCMVHHHDNHPIIESQSGSRLRHSPPGFPSPSGPPYGVCGTGSCCQKKAPLCLQGMKDIWFSSLPFLSAQHFLRALRPVPRRCPSML